jgi:hypothetical protein
MNKEYFPKQFILSYLRSMMKICPARLFLSLLNFWGKHSQQTLQSLKKQSKQKLFISSNHSQGQEKQENSFATMAKLWSLRNYKQKSSNSTILPWTSRYQSNRRNHWAAAPLVAKNEKANHKLSHSLLHLSTKQAQDIRQFGHLPEKKAEAITWDKMCIDLIGPFTIRKKGQANLICKCVINLVKNEQSLSQTLPKRNGFPDTLGQHKSPLILA